MNKYSLRWLPAALMYRQCCVNVVFVTYYLCWFFSYSKAHEKYLDTYSMYLRLKNDVNVAAV